MHDITLTVDADGSAIIEYSTASYDITCNDPANFQIKLTLSNGLTSTKSYIPQTTNKFLLHALDPSQTIKYTLQVIDIKTKPVGSPYTGYIYQSSTTIVPTTTSINVPTSTGPSAASKYIKTCLILLIAYF